MKFLIKGFCMVLCFAMSGCHFGWRLVDESKGRFKNKIEELAYVDLPDPVKECFLKKNKGHYGLYFVCDSSYLRIDSLFEVSADWNGSPLRKMGTYLWINGKKYFIERPVGGPIIIYKNYMYYTREYGLVYADETKRNAGIFYRVEMEYVDN